MSAPSEIIVTPESLEVGGRRRTLTVVDRRPPVPRPVPMMLVFHGSQQTGAVIRSFTGGAFDRLGEPLGAVVAYLDGHKKHWNDARIANSSAARTDGVDDVAFARATIDLLAERYGGDRARVYVVGFSNGGQMVIRLVHEIPGMLAGAAILSAAQSVPDNFAPDAEQNEPVPILLVHGTKDVMVPYAGGMAKMMGILPRGVGLSAAETAAYFARRNGITAGAVTTPRDSGVSGRTWVERSDYREPGREPVTLYTVHGGGHTIPGPKKAPRLMGRTDHTLDTTRAINEFFGLTADTKQA